MLNQSLALANIKKLASKDLNEMDLVINAKLDEREKLVQDITYHIINSGGKRLRPILSILSAKLFGYEGKRHINLSAAVEFIHTATLLHDDVVDHSNLRRGRPTANKNWNNKSSILVGDFLFSQAFVLMAEDGDIEVLKILSKAASIIAEGEVKQLYSIANLDLSIEQYMSIISAKTAELFAAACQVGAIVAGADESAKLNMYNFGLSLGKAFQIMDDVLDYVANDNSLGKNIGDDFQEAKVTLPVIIAYQRSDNFERVFWNKVIDIKLQEDGDFMQALKIFNKYNIIETCADIAKKSVDEAKACLSMVPKSVIRNSLMDVLDFCVDRKF